jgi:hypothetical protein
MFVNIYRGRLWPYRKIKDGNSRKVRAARMGLRLFFTNFVSIHVL